MKIAFSILTILLEFILVSACTPSSLVEWSDSVENRWMQTWYGTAQKKTIRKRTHTIFQRYFVNTGVVNFSYYMVLPTEEEWNRGRPFNYVEDTIGIFSFFAGRLNAFWHQVQQMLERLYLLSVWSLCMVAIWGISIVDGLCMRKLKDKTFGYHSPLLHRYGLYVSGWIWLLLVAWIVSPLPVHPMAYPVTMLIQGWLMSVIMANLQRRI